MLDLTSHSYPAEYDELRRRGVPGIDIERLTFSIMHGNGNIILVVDEALSGLSGRELGGDLARELCGSFLSIRVDGVAFVRTATEPVRMTYFERDGTHSQMCGNALRCVTRYGTEQGYLRADADVVMTDDGPKRVSAARWPGPGRPRRRAGIPAGCPGPLLRVQRARPSGAAA